MKLGEQICGVRSARVARIAKRIRRRSIRRAWRQRGEVIHDGRYHGWTD